jgi:SAM-dependent methyltransferase
MPRNYRYPDTNDEIISVAIGQDEPFPGFWDESAIRGLDLLGRELGMLLPHRGAVHGLDAGCGEGRLLPWMAKFAAAITAVDADSDRVGKARALTAIADATLQFDCRPITDIEGGPYNLIVCSHVVQHVPTTAVAPILLHLARVASPKAAMVLAFSRSAIDNESYGLSYLDGGRACVDVIDRYQFDTAAGRRDHRGSVPFRRIDPERLAGEARAAGWSLHWKWTYHIFSKSGRLCDREEEELVNSSQELERNSSGDIYTLWRRE